MASTAQQPSQVSNRLTPGEREWIRRQGRSARALEAEQRRAREKLVAEELRRRRRDGRRFQR